tara:strand:- start:931 stop:1887 length:957 start_codon:yes stop_codon:yes gene_type:complete
MKLVVVTGCLGFIGSHVVNKCLGMGWRVYGIDNQTYASNPSLIKTFKSHYKDKFTYINEDIADLKYLPDCDYVINTAAETHVGNSIIDSKAFLRTNIDGVQNLLELIKAKPANVASRPVLFHFSTDEVYGDIADGEHTEDDPLNPSNPYSASKAAGDILIKAWARTYGIEYFILRPANNYGTYQYPEKLFPLAVKLLMRDKKIRLHDEGTPIRSWLHAEDTANAVISIIINGKINEIYNVSGGFEQQNVETIREIIKAFHGTDENWEQHVDLGHKRPGQDVRYALNDDKLRSLGWEPEKIFNEEIENLVKFYTNNFKW